jgi:hypothetical protein
MSTSEFLRPYPSQYELRGDTYSCYGSDFRGCVNYKFNNQGYRSDFDYDLNSQDCLAVCLGSSIATGHGLELNETFGSLVADYFGKTLWNLGQGCFRSNNQTVLDQVKFLINTDLNIDYFLIQFTHINRCGSDVESYLELDAQRALENFENILTQVSCCLSGKKWCWMLADYSGADLPQWIQDHPNKIIVDPDSVDFVETAAYANTAPSRHALKMLSLHPGPNWNQHIATLMIDYFNESSPELERPSVKSAA